MKICLNHILLRCAYCGKKVHKNKNGEIHMVSFGPLDKSVPIHLRCRSKALKSTAGVCMNCAGPVFDMLGFFCNACNRFSEN